MTPSFPENFLPSPPILQSYSKEALWRYLPHIALLQTPITFADKTKQAQFPIEALVDYYHRALHAPSPLFPKENDPYLAFVTPDSTQPWEDVCQNLIV